MLDSRIIKGSIMIAVVLFLLLGCYGKRLLPSRLNAFVRKEEAVYQTHLGNFSPESPKVVKSKVNHHDCKDRRIRRLNIGTEHC